MNLKGLLRGFTLKLGYLFVSIIIGLILSFSNVTEINANNDYRIDKSQIETLVDKARVVEWEEANKILRGNNEDFVVVDYYTGNYFTGVRTGGSNHADIETADKESTMQLKEASGQQFSWNRRPVLIILKDGTVLIASIHTMAHAGLDNKPFKEVVNNRSANYGKGVNYDKVKNNNMDGHICLHFKGSKTHVKNKVDTKHQENIRIIQRAK